MDKVDIQKAENFLKAMYKGHFNDIIGYEILALADSYHWLRNKVDEAKKELENGENNTARTEVHSDSFK